MSIDDDKWAAGEISANMARIASESVDPSEFETTHEAARKEVAALAGLFLARLQNVEPEADWLEVNKAIWGEALNDFGKVPDEPV